VDAFTESRDLLCHECKSEWAEVNNPFVGGRSIEKHKLNTYSLEVTVTVTHSMSVRVWARNEAEAVGKAQLADFDEIVKDDHWQVVSVDEHSVQRLGEQNLAG
jgi:hypothetical protein